MNGPNLERWFLKTLINIVVVGKERFSIGSYRGDAGEPSRELVEIAFGQKRFERGAGLYFLSHDGLIWEPREGVSCISWIHESQVGSYIAAGEFWFYGCPFFLTLDGFGKNRASLAVQLRDRSLNLHYHLSRINFQLEGDVVQTINFQW